LAHHVDRGIDGHGRERRITGPRCDIDRGIEVDALERRKRPLCRTCVDWSERKHHLGGAIGAAVLAAALVKSWAVRGPRSRAVTFSAPGEKKFVAWYSSE
jgi:hypothetical protein